MVDALDAKKATHYLRSDYRCLNHTFFAKTRIGDFRPNFNNLNVHAKGISMKRLLVTMLLLLSAFPVFAAGVGGIFGQGRVHYALMGGNGYAFDNNYLVIGASASYYVLDGLGVGFSIENWSGGDPGIVKYAPFVQYVFNLESSIQPYVGGFFRHTAISGLPGINSVGGRAGVHIAAGPNAYMSAGFVYESYLDCQRATYRTCSASYPEIGLTFGF